MGIMSALPVDPTPREDPLDPESILRALPERERETFLAEYRRAIDGAHDPARLAGAAAVPAAVGLAGDRRGRAGLLRGLGQRTRARHGGGCCWRTRSGCTIPARELSALAGGAGAPPDEAACPLKGSMSWSRRWRASAKTRTTGCSAWLCRKMIPRRMAELGDFGFVEFMVDEAAGLVRVLTLVWVG